MFTICDGIMEGVIWLHMGVPTLGGATCREKEMLPKSLTGTRPSFFDKPICCENLTNGDAERIQYKIKQILNIFDMLF